MNPIEFDGHNVVYGKEQSEYNPLPAHIDAEGVVTSCWELNTEDLAEINKTGRLYISQMTFNKALQPINVFTNVVFLTPEDLNKE